MPKTKVILRDGPNFHSAHFTDIPNFTLKDFRSMFADTDNYYALSFEYFDDSLG
jgi:hypothetical protein